MKIRLLLVGLLLAELVFLYDQRFGLPDPLTPVWTRVRAASPGAPTVVFVVLDTVRADHTAVCGYERPNTPFMSQLKADGAGVSCHAYSPGSWTMPSHASFFTGAPVPEHGVHFVSPTEDDKRVFDGTGFYTRPLDDTLPTLAEYFTEAGYQTLSVSANPLISEETGLTRGFETVAVVNSPGWKVVRSIVSRLRWSLDRERPLFLFVNLGDAHEPWEPVPSGLDWVPPRSAIGWGGSWSPYGLDDLFPSMYPASDNFDRLMRRELSGPEKDAWIAHVTDVYDHGIYLADEAVRQLVEGLVAHGWADDGLRLVVTSDHGEHLGEHDLGDHGRFVHEPVVRVPVLAWDTQGSPTLPEPMAGTDVFQLVRDGVAPSEGADVVTYAFPDVMWEKVYGRGGQTSIGVVGDGNKWLWRDGAVHHVDLVKDPLGIHPSPTEDVAEGMASAFDRAVRSVQDADTEGSGVDEDIAERLRQIGYVD